jgi:hypothetical protein
MALQAVDRLTVEWEPGHAFPHSDLFEGPAVAQAAGVAA